MDIGGERWSANPVDSFIWAKWKAAGLPEAEHPPRLGSDEIFVRRLYLDIIGVVPTIAEAKRFLEDAAQDKRSRLIDELLARG